MKVILKKIIAIFVMAIIVLNAIGVNASFAQLMKEPKYRINYTHSTGILMKGRFTQENPYVTYGENNDGIAYCLDETKMGAYVGSTDYFVTPEKKLDNINVWRAIINGYPIKSIQELNCLTKEEAYEATHEAIYCLLGRRSFSDLSVKDSNEQLNENSTIKESGQRVLNAIKQILDNVEQSTEVPPTPKVNMNSEEWKETTNENGEVFISKKCQITSDIMNGKYTLTILDPYPHILPEGLKIVDIHDNEMDSFENGEFFKVVVPKKNILKDFDLFIKVDTNMNTWSVYDAYHEDSSKQNYGLVVPVEKYNVTQVLHYQRAKGHIEIVKMDADTNEKLKNAEFNILDLNNNIVKSRLITDENGNIRVDDLSAGTYYLEETKAPEEYQKLKETVKFELKENQYLTINVKNQKVNKVIQNVNTGVINISTEYKESVNNVDYYTEEIVQIGKKETNNKSVQTKNTETNNLSQNNNEKSQNKSTKTNTTTIQNTNEIEDLNKITNINTNKTKENNTKNSKDNKIKKTEKDLNNQENIEDDVMKQKQEKLNSLNKSGTEILPITGM